MLDLGLSFLGSVARDPDALAIVDGEVRLTYAQWYRRISSLVAGFDAIGLEGRRSPRHRAAEPLGGGDPALGLPVRRRRHHAGELALDRERDRFLSRGRRGQGDRLRGRVRRGRCRIGLGAATAADRARCRAGVGHRLCIACFASGAGCRAARRCRGLVGDALHVRHHGAAEGRAAPPARRARRRGRACGAKSLRPRRAHARRHAALSHDGGALAAGHVAHRRRLRLPAPLRRRRGARS